jgi:hypothetical protein
MEELWGHAVPQGYVKCPALELVALKLLVVYPFLYVWLLNNFCRFLTQLLSSPCLIGEVVSVLYPSKPGGFFYVPPGLKFKKKFKLLAFLWQQSTVVCCWLNNTNALLTFRGNNGYTNATYW